MTVPGFCTQCGCAAPEESIRCAGCDALLPFGDARDHPRRLARDLAVALGSGFEVVGLLGRGGFAHVLKVKDRAADRWLAAKFVAPELTASQSAMERFRRETAMAEVLSHPNIVPILFARATDDFAYAVMPLVEGEPLAERLARDGALPLAVAAGIVRDVAAALDAAHAAGIVHRDVKTDNILLEAGSGRALLADFGVAMAEDGPRRLTATGFVLGTPHYVSPEQASGERTLDGRTDVYSLGVVAYEMLAGRPPYVAENPSAVYAMHVVAPVPDVRAARPEVPDVWARAVARALAKDPADRFATAGAFAAAMTTEPAPGGPIVAADTR